MVNDPLTGGSVTLDTSTLALGASASGTATYLVTQADIATGQIQNRATADSAQTAVGSDGTTVAILQQPSLAFDKFIDLPADLNDVDPRPGGLATLSGPNGFSVAINGYEQVRVEGGGGNDHGILRDVTGTEDLLKLKDDNAALVSDGDFAVVKFFASLEAITTDSLLDRIQQSDDVLDYVFTRTGDWLE